VRGIRGASPQEEREGYGGKEKGKFFKAWNERVKGWWMMLKSGESMEPMEEVLLKGLSDAELERLVHAVAVDSQRIATWLTERSRELIPETRESILEETI